jgi:hypothetical protein
MTGNLITCSKCGNPARIIHDLDMTECCFSEVKKEGRMTHQQAVEELKEMAGGRPWSLKYEVGSFYPIPAIRGYIENLGVAPDAATYAEAIETLKRMLGLEKCDPAPEDTEGVNP